MKKQIRYYFTDFWSGFNFKNQIGYLLDEYDLIFDKEDPDYLFYSSFGTDHLFYNDCIKIFWTYENTFPDLNLCDYAVCLSEIQSFDRIYRRYLPWLYKGTNFVINDLKPDKLLDRKFCNFIYSNDTSSDPYREIIFRELSKYKKVDSGGAFLNNMGKRVDDKLLFLKDYKFTLSIENSSVQGYTTEKIFHPFLAQSLPLYWGNPNISSDYHPNSFVNLMEFASVEEAVGEIIRLDQDDNAYLEKVMSPFWPYGNSFEEFYNCESEKMMAFWHHVFDQPKEKAYRRTMYGNIKHYASRQIQEKRMKMKMKTIGLNNRVIRSILTKLIK